MLIFATMKIPIRAHLHDIDNDRIPTSFISADMLDAHSQVMYMYCRASEHVLVSKFSS